MEVYGSELDSLRLRHGQLNLLLFLPSGVLVGLTALWPRRARLLVPSGLAVLAAYSILIELIQQELASLRRACDLNDFIDNLAGAAAGVTLGLLLALLALWTTRRRGDSPLRLGPASGRRRTQTTGTTPPSSTGSRQ